MQCSSDPNDENEIGKIYLRLTDPFTGASLDAVKLDDHLIFEDPLDPISDIVCDIVRDDYIKMPLESFRYRELIESKDACMELHVSRQRISQLADKGILKPIYLGNSQYFLMDDVLNYKKNRKPGRPKKETS